MSGVAAASSRSPSITGVAVCSSDVGCAGMLREATPRDEYHEVAAPTNLAANGPMPRATDRRPQRAPTLRHDLGLFHGRARRLGNPLRLVGRRQLFLARGKLLAQRIEVDIGLARLREQALHALLLLFDVMLDLLL